MSNVKNGAKLSAIIGVAFAYMTTFFGGGWATGSQAGAYFTQHGWTAFIMPLGGLFLISCVMWITVEYARLNNAWNYGIFMERLYGPKVVATIFDIIQIISMPITFAACIATFASTLQSFIGGSYILYVVLFAVIVILSVIWGTEVVNKLASIMGTAILALLAVIFVTVLSSGYGNNVVNMVKERTMYTSYGEAFWWGTIKFCMLTGGLGLSVLPCFEPLQTRSDVTKSVLWSFLFCGFFLVVINFSVEAFMPEAINETLPMYYGIVKMGALWLTPVYVVVVCLAVITTGNAMCYGYGMRFASLKVFRNWSVSEAIKLFVISLIIIGISSAVSMLGLTTIIYKGYSYVSYLNTPLVSFGIPVFGIIKLVQIRRRGYTLDRGVLEGTGSWDMFRNRESAK